MMIRFYRPMMFSLAFISLVGCGRPAPAPSARVEQSVAPRESLSHLVEAYWDESATSSPWYSWGGAELRRAEAPADSVSAQSLADSLAVERRYLAAVLLVPRAPLDADARLTYDIFWRERELAIESFTYPAELMPVNAYDSVPQRFALMATAAERHALTSAKDLEIWQNRAGYFERWTDQAIGNLREGLRRGYKLPRSVVDRVLPQLAALGADTPANVFFQRPPPGAPDAGDGADGGAGAGANATGAAAVAVNAAPAATAIDAAANGDAAAGAAGSATAGPAAPAPPRAPPAPPSPELSAALDATVRDKILPAYRALHDFLQKKYLPHARDSVGLWALPLGGTWYAHLIKRATGGSATPAELHALGVAEVEHVRARLGPAAVVAPGAVGPAVAAGATGATGAVGAGAETLSTYEALKVQLGTAAPTLFNIAPRADFEIRRVEAFREATTPALSYRRAMAYGKYAAVLYVNTTALAPSVAGETSADFLREAVPGHHYQLALQQERADLPRFRRFGGAPAFIAGWGVYAASLGEELGVTRDAPAKAGALLAQLECAAGLVIDTGIHAQKWTRQQAVDYVHAQVPVNDATVANLVDRAIALPGEALACTVGYLKIQSLRTRAQQTLGARFDVQAFHAEVLKNGAVPLDLLEANLKQWETAVASAPKVE
jgi:uncharacterized protein (DUF885 family)